MGRPLMSSVVPFPGARISTTPTGVVRQMGGA